MAKRTLSLTLPDGTVAERTTAHAYTHVLVMVESTEPLVRGAECTLARVAQERAEDAACGRPADWNAGYYAACERIAQRTLQRVQGRAQVWGACSWHQTRATAEKALRTQQGRWAGRPDVQFSIHEVPVV